MVRMGWLGRECKRREKSSFTQWIVGRGDWFGLGGLGFEGEAEDMSWWIILGERAGSWAEVV